MADARRYSWPPFEAGHMLSMRHGAGSDRKISPLADRLAESMVQEAPWLGRPAFASALAAWARAEASVLLIAEYLDEKGVLDGDGIPLAAANFAERLEARASKARARLGLDPVAFAGLLTTFAGAPGAEDVLESLGREGRAIMEARDARALPAPAALAAAEVP